MKGQVLDVWVAQVRDGKLSLTAVPPVDLSVFADIPSSDGRKV